MKKKYEQPVDTSKLRQSAEDKLSKVKKKTASLSSPKVDFQHLVYELEVHQIELEMQNVELIQSRAQEEAVLHQYESLYDISPVGYFTLTQNGTIQQVNLTGANLLGMESGKLLKRRFGLFVSPKSRTVFAAFLEKVFSAAGEKQTCEVELLKGKSKSLWVQISAVCDAAYETCHAVVVDISESKQSEEALQRSEERYRAVVEWTPEAIVIHRDGKIIYVNPAAIKIFGAKTERELVGKPILDRVHSAFHQIALTRAKDIIEQGTSVPVVEQRLLKLDGTIIDAEVQSTSILYDGELAFHTSMRDVTARKQAESALRKSEHFAKVISDNLPGMLGYWTPDLRCTFANKEYNSWFGRTAEQMHGIYMQDLMGDELFQRNEPYARAALRGEDQQFERTLVKPNGETRYTWVQYISHYLNGEVQGFFVLVTDITSVKLSQEQIRVSEEKWRSLFEILPVGISVLDTDHALTEFNPALAKIMGVNIEGLGDSIYKQRKYIHSDGSLMPPEEFPSTRAIQEQTVIQSVEVGIVKEDGGTIWTEVSAAPLLLPGLECVIVTTDITERKQKKHELETLANISAILRKADSRADMLSIFLDQLTSLQNANGAAIALYDPATGESVIELAMGEFVSETGQRLAPNVGMVGHVIKTGKLYLNNEARSDTLFSKPALLKNIDALVCVPLIAHAETIGAVWVGRKGFINEYDLRLLTSIADMVANTIHRMTLYEQTQLDALELAQAYDSTIEGWSHALDLRDNETEGHSLRVTEMALRLAQTAGMTEEELVHIRRGALLHDIGKMGIPDAILLKPGKLTDEEWVTMRKHPQYAYDMLSFIDYLRPALEIPYCHHERWDGTGYPRGLKGEQIPLSARLFAVADVWDALCSNRRYREGWTHEKVLEHIRKQTGTHFDPRAVEIFFQVMNKENL